jgi:hypothetical protein
MISGFSASSIGSLHMEPAPSAGNIGPVNTPTIKKASSFLHQRLSPQVEVPADSQNFPEQPTGWPDQKYFQLSLPPFNFNASLS